MISAKVVFPVPGGPQKMRELSVSFSIILLMVPDFPVRCSCPRTSSRDLGRRISARGVLFINQKYKVFANLFNFGILVDVKLLLGIV